MSRFQLSEKGNRIHELPTQSRLQKLIGEAVVTFSKDTPSEPSPVRPISSHQLVIEQPYPTSD